MTLQLRKFLKKFLLIVLLFILLLGCFLFVGKSKPAEEMVAKLSGEVTIEITKPEEEESEEDIARNMRAQSREFIKDKITQLDWEEMQELVAGLLRAMGYKTRISPAGPDRGKDIIASPDGFGFEQPRIVVEVKQLELTPEEKDHMRKFREEKSTGVVHSEPGKRLRKVIDSGMPQLKEVSQCKHPTMLVVYDNSGFPITRLEHYEINSGMHGLEQVEISVPANPNISPFVSGHKYGPNQKVSESHNTTLSAITIIRKPGEGSFFLDIYYNDYAKNPIHPLWLNHDIIHHWIRKPSDKPNQYRSWQDYDFGNA